MIITIKQYKQYQARFARVTCEYIVTNHNLQQYSYCKYNLWQLQHVVISVVNYLNHNKFVPM